jgi:predicted nucleic acid-binding protein
LERIEKIKTILKDTDVIGLDTMVFIYHFKENKRYCPLTMVLLKLIESEEKIGVTSIISLPEILVKPIKDGREYLVREYEFVFETFHNLSYIEIDSNVAKKAARLRADYNLKTPDAIQLSAALLKGAKVYITNDNNLKR